MVIVVNSGTTEERLLLAYRAGKLQGLRSRGLEMFLALSDDMGECPFKKYTNDQLAEISGMTLATARRGIFECLSRKLVFADPYSDETGRTYRFP